MDKKGPLRYGNGLEMVITNLRDKGDKDGMY